MSSWPLSPCPKQHYINKISTRIGTSRSKKQKERKNTNDLSQIGTAQDSKVWTKNLYLQYSRYDNKIGTLKKIKSSKNKSSNGCIYTPKHNFSSCKYFVLSSTGFSIILLPVYRVWPFLLQRLHVPIDLSLVFVVKVLALEFWLCLCFDSSQSVGLDLLWSVDLMACNKVIGLQAIWVSMLKNVTKYLSRGTFCIHLDTLWLLYSSVHLTSLAICRWELVVLKHMARLIQHC